MGKKSSGKNQASGDHNSNLTSSSKEKTMPINEQELVQRFEKAVKLNENLEQVKITPEECLSLTKPTENYLCPKKANIYDIEFIKFRVRDFSNKSTEPNVQRPVLIDISKPPNYQPSEDELSDPTNGRFVRYHLHSDFLELKALGAQITFTVGGNRVVKKFRMIERHYFKEKLIKSFDFDFGAALIPNSENSIEHIYDMPKLDNKLKRQMVEFPWETRSDSFYFVEDRLIMHNKAEYAYNYEY